jgi:hypothetical protein
MPKLKYQMKSQCQMSNSLEAVIYQRSKKRTITKAPAVACPPAWASYARQAKEMKHERNSYQPFDAGCEKWPLQPAAQDKLSVNFKR